MERLNLSRPLKANAIYIKGNSKPLRDRTVFIAGNFLIVAKDAEDTAPTWYNVDQVNRLEGVTQEPPQATRQLRLFT